MRAIALIVLLMASIGAVPAATDPWAFSPEERKDAEKDPDSNMWASNYTRATDELKREKPDLEKAIRLLKLAILKRPFGSPNETHPTTNERFEYFPYFHLADALSRQGKHGAAKQCLDKDAKAAASPGLKARYAALRERIEVMVARETLVGDAGVLVAWDSNVQSIRLSGSDAAGAVSRVKSLKDRLEKAGNADVTPQVKELRDAIVGVCESEMRIRAGWAGDLGREPWTRAFPAAADRPPAASCQAPPPDPGSLDTGALIRALQECDSRVAGGLRRAGRWKCGELKQSRTSLVQDLAQAKVEAPEKAAGLGSPEAISADSCDPFEKAEATGLGRAFEALGGDYKRLEDDFQKRSVQVAGLLGDQEKRRREQVEQALNKLPVVLGPCADVLGVKESVKEMATLRERLSDALKEKGPRASRATDVAAADAARDRFVEAARKGVTGLLDRGRNAKVPEQNLKDLETRGSALSTPDAPIGSLCEKAIAVNNIIGEFWRGNVDALRKESGFRADLVGIVVRGCSEPGTPNSVAACRDSAPQVAYAQLEHARKGPTGQAQEAWVRAAQSAIAAGDQALAPFHEGVEASFREMSKFMTDVPGVLDEVEPALMDGSPEGSASQAQPGMKRWAEQVRKDASETARKLSAVHPLFGETADLGEKELRERLRQAGIDGNLRNEDWALLAPGQGGGPGGDGAALPTSAGRVIRDAAVLRLLAQTLRQRDEWEPFLAGARPFATLNLVLRDFARGNLDEAILGLRKAEQQPWMSGRGRAPALAHAVMALMLDAKSAAVAAAGGEDRVIESLRLESRQKAKAAREADGTFRAPKGLFKSQSLQINLERLLQDATAG